MTSTLTPRQKEVYEFLVQRINEDRRAPTVREIGTALGITSPNGVLGHIAALEKKGLISRGRNGTCRSIKVIAVEAREAAERAVVKAAVEFVDKHHNWGMDFERLAAAVKEYRRL